MYEEYKIYGPYTRKDGRQHCVLIKHNENKEIVERITISYPRILMEEKLGRPLEPFEDVHHIDGDFTNNSVHNLQVINHSDHEKLHFTKYKDIEKVCEVCGKKFL